MVKEKESEVAQSCLTPCGPMDCSLPGSSIHGIFQARVLEWGAIPSKSTGVGCQFLLQGIFLTQRLNPGLPNCRQMLYFLSHQGSYLASVWLLSIYSRRRWEHLSGHRPLCLLLRWMVLRTVAFKLYCTLKCLQSSEISPSPGCIADQLNQSAC